VEHYNTFVGSFADINPGGDPATSPVSNATAVGARAYVAQSNSLVLGSIKGGNDATSYVNVVPATPLGRTQCGVRFNWKDSGKAAVGLIAEEVDAVLPEIVAHGGEKATDVNYANLVAVLVEAVKEQQAKIEEQGARLEKLEKLLSER